MKVTFIGHASILAEHDGISVLSDPWWKGPCFGAQWWNRPAPITGLAYARVPDFIYISHGHHDHLHPGTLKTLSRKSKILVSSQLDLAGGLRDLGFDVLELTPEMPFQLSDTFCVWIWPTHGGDTLMVLQGAEETCINLNDALHAASPEVKSRNISMLNKRFPRAEYVFCGYGVASHFPNCYSIPGKDDAATAARRQRYFNEQWARIIHELQPEYAFPFAANVVFLEACLVNFNEAIHNSERPVDTYRRLFGETQCKLVDIAPGFEIDRGMVTANNGFRPLDTTSLLASEEAAFARANAYSDPSDSQVRHVTGLLRDNIALCKAHLLELKRNYTFQIAFRGSQKGIAIQKQGDQITAMPVLSGALLPDHYDIRFWTRAVYLRRALEEDYADEVLFVGSGCMFEYRSRSDADENLHRELILMVRKHHLPPPSRYGDNPVWLFRLKKLVKRLLGRTPEELYDLRSWIVYGESEVGS